MAPKLFDHTMVSTTDDALEFIGNVLESSTEYSIIGKDVEGKILLWNEGARRIYGYEPEEVVGKANSSILYTPEDVEAGRPEEMLKAALRAGKWEGTIKRRRKSGQRFTARVVITPRRDRAGRLVGFLLISKDISDEIGLTEQLKATQFYTRSLIESNIDALMTVDPLGVITDVNQQTATLTGYTREELIGSPFKTHFTDSARAEEGVRLALREGRVTNYELTALSKDGRMTVVSYNASTFHDHAGQLEGVFAAARDITEQKKLERQLRDSEAYNRGLIEASVDGLVTVDSDGVISDVNEQMCRMSGCSREKLIGTPFANYFVDRERAASGVRETFEKGVVTDYVLTLAQRDGRRLYVSFNASVFKDPAGAVRGIFASARDITERTVLQTQLAEQQAYNRGLIEASLDGLVTVDPTLHITDVNESMCRMSGCTREELIGSEFPNYFTDPKHAADGVHLTLDTGAVTNYELRLLTKNGGKRLVSFNASIFRSAEGQVQGIFASARDITEQARLQEELAYQHAYNRSLIEASADALFAIAPDGTITDVNAEAMRLTGYSRADLINSRFKHYFTDPDRAEQGVKQVLQLGKVTDYELTALGKDGAETVVSYNATTFYDRNNRLQGVFAAARDVTERKRFERTLQEKNAELETANLAKDRFLASMSHELRTPLNAILGFTGALLMGLPGPLTPDQRKQLETVKISAKHQLSLINDLLDLAKIESGKISLKFEPVAGRSVVEEVAQTLRPLAESKGLSFEVTAPQQDFVIHTDRRTICQVAINLASNAIKFTEKGAVRVCLRQFDGTVELSVSDTGVGIKSEDQHKLFEAFARLDQGDMRRQEGTGLGLHLSQKLAHLLGGKIVFKSEYQKGSIFTLVIPSKRC